MRTIVVGCEYAGTTTLSEAIMGWAKLTFGGEHFFHDHMKIPHISHGTLSEDDIKHFMALSPDLKEQFQRFQVEYHLQPEFYEDDDHHNVGFFIDEAVYAPLYYGYDQEGGRTWHARKIEARIMEMAPDTVLVLVKASPEVIAKRKKENPHPHDLVQEKDIELVLKKFQEQFDASLLRKKVTIDTSNATVEESLAEFVENVKPMLSQADRVRMLLHQSEAARGA